MNYQLFQNIDGLEIVAGIDPDLVVAAHGTFHSAHCTACQKEYSEEWEKGLRCIFFYKQPSISKYDYNKSYSRWLDIFLRVFLLAIRLLFANLLFKFHIDSFGMRLQCDC